MVTWARGSKRLMAHGKPEAGTVIRNYLYYHQKGRDKSDLYLGTSKSAEGYAARITFQRAKEEGMDVAIHWQDADSSSAKAVIPEANHVVKFWKNVRKYHQPILKSIRMISPSYVRITSNVSVWCITAVVLLTPKYTPISLLLQSQEEFVKRVKALPRHAVDDHSQCDYHPLVVCSCGACDI